MKNIFKNTSIVLLVSLIFIIKSVLLSIFSLVPLFLLEMPMAVNMLLFVFFMLSTFRCQGYKIDALFKFFSVLSIPLNIALWGMALYSFAEGSIDCNATVFYVLLVINLFSIITKLPKIFKNEDETVDVDL